jgi:hypothetical protein
VTQNADTGGRYEVFPTADPEAVRKIMDAPSPFSPNADYEALIAAAREVVEEHDQHRGRWLFVPICNLRKALDALAVNDRSET